jgi:hypothetical protein
MTSGGFDRGGLWRGDVGEALGPNGIGFPVGVRVLVVGELAFHDECDALFQLGMIVLANSLDALTVIGMASLSPLL